MKFPRLWTSACADLLSAFNEGGVEYLLVGSMAKSFHYPKLACVNDMDLMISPTAENARRVLAALRAVRGACDLEQLALNIQKLAKENVRLHLLKGQGDVDLLTPPSRKRGLAFHEAAGRSTEELVPGLSTPVRVAAICDLEALDRLREGSDGR